MGNRGRRWLTAIAVAATLTAACNGDDDADGSPVITDPVENSSSTSSSSSTTSTTTDPQAEVKAEVEAAYLAYWDAWLEIFAAPDPANPLIEQHTTGRARTETLEAVSEDVVNGTSVRLPVDENDWDPRVLSVVVDGGEATVRSCLIDGSVVIESATGAVLNDAVATYLREATMLREAHAWKLAQSRTIERRDGRWSCEG